MKNPKFIIQICGGMCNQMFQYAHARALQKEFGGEILLDLHWFKTAPKHLPFALMHFKAKNNYKTTLSFSEKIALYYLAIIRRILTLFPGINSEKKFIMATKFGIYDQFRWPWFNTLKKPIMPVNYIIGGYFSDKYFKTAAKEVIEDFKVVEQLEDRIIEKAQELSACNSVCVHIRLGDYLAPGIKEKLFVCNEYYYETAVKKMGELVEKPVFYIFSNSHQDFQNIKKMFDFGDAVIKYVDMSNKDFEDLYLMSHCKHFIVSNSTYSWWGQYLSTNSNKIVMAPVRWNNLETDPGWDPRDIYMDNWIRINNTEQSF